MLILNSENNDVTQAKTQKDPFQKEKSSFRMGKRNMRQARTQYLGNIAAVAGLIILFVGGYFLVDYFSKKQSQTDPNEVRIEPDSFEDILNNGNLIQLINEYNLIEKQPGASLPEIIDGLKKRVQLTDKMLELKDDPQAKNFGTIAKLRALSQWDFINVTNDFDDEVTRFQLEELANSKLEDENPEVRSSAQISQMLVGLNDFARAPEDHDFQDTHERLKKTASLAANDLVAAGLLFRCAELLNIKGLQKESAAAYKLLSDAFAESEVPAIQSMAVNAKKQYLAVEFDLNDIPNNLDVDRAGSLAIIRDRIDAILDQGRIGAEEVEAVVRLIELLLGRNEIDEVREQLPKVAEHVAALDRDPNNMKQKYNDILGQSKAFGKPFDFSGLRSVADQPIDTTSIVKSVRIVLFWSPEDPKSVERVSSLNIQGRYYKRIGVDLTTIYLDKGSAPANLEFKNLALDMPQITFYRLPVNDDEGKEFLKRFPVTKTPSVVLLDVEGNIQGVNPPAFGLRTELERLAFEAEQNKK